MSVKYCLPVPIF